MTYLPDHLLDDARKGPILLTGSAGYLGTELAKQFRSARIDFVGVDKRGREGPEAQQFDLADRDTTNALFKDLSPVAVIHGGTHSALAYRDDFKGSFQEDFEGVLSLLGNLERAPDTRLLFFSSTYVYGGLDPTMRVNEETAPHPVHNFGVAKLFFEQFILRNHRNSVVFRLASVFGQGAQRHPNALADMVEECRKEKRLTVWGEGRRRMQYIYLEEVTQSIMEALSLPPGLYNLGGIDYPSVSETASLVAEFFDADVEYLVSKPEGDTLPFMDTGRLRAASSERNENRFSDVLAVYLRSIPAESEA
jgi:nucleoside-diphosphate-sugar epimerase